MSSKDYLLPVASTLTGVALYYLLRLLNKKDKPKKKSHKQHRPPPEEQYLTSEMSDANSSNSGYLTEAGNDVTDLRRLVIPKLVDSPIHPHSKEVFDTLLSMYSLIVCINLFN